MDCQKHLGKGLGLGRFINEFSDPPKLVQVIEQLACSLDTKEGAPLEAENLKIFKLASRMLEELFDVIAPRISDKDK